MSFVELFKIPLTANVIDVGAGDSYFVDALLEKGYKNIWVLDISASAIEKVKQRLGARASDVHWIVDDISTFQPEVMFDLWHDRAAFHFLTRPDEIEKYSSKIEHAIRPNGHLVLGTFSEEGPTTCSGLEIRRYSATSMPAIFQSAFDKIKCVIEDHVTPFQTHQNFIFCGFNRKAESC